MSITNTKDRRPGDSMVLDTRRQPLVLRTLVSPRIADLVTEFRIKFPYCVGPSKLLQSLLLVDRCLCADLDTRLGKALTSLPNLQVLHINCLFCPDEEDTRHRYLADLVTTSLRELCLYCKCSRIRIEKSQHILSAPCMQSVITLDWIASGGRVRPDVYDVLTHTYRKVLPLVTKLRYGRTVDLEGIVAGRPITHLGCHTMKDGLHGALSKNTGALNRLRVDENWSNINFYMGRDPEPYRSLRHFGCFRFIGCASNYILKQMLPFAILEHLQSIEVFNHTIRLSRTEDREERNPWKVSLLDSLYKQHRRLKKIFIKDLVEVNKLTGEKCDCFLWERRESWERYSVSQFTDWDMVLGFEPQVVH
ncbi:hypothetical protein M408DRAFT_29093 [Serendipita vermifera MAFF 305830]|uniref:F-box domain-containing protein n=1 Tax=Serendipita vermifera MAFF 305830 TaxID=933852 RepID=A0A0C3ABI0_SERVB|nr:hypothetical protein M408DRAFT_29093 [Serendipita vermifera MAFF 305830]